MMQFYMHPLPDVKYIHVPDDQEISQCNEMNNRILHNHTNMDSILVNKDPEVLPKPLSTLADSINIAPSKVKGVTKKMDDMTLDRQSDNSNTLSNMPIGNVPPPWFTKYMETLKEDIVNEVSSKVVKNILDILNKPTLELQTVPQTEDPVQLQGEAAALNSKQNPEYLHSEEKKQYKKKKRMMDKRKTMDILSKYDEKIYSCSIKTTEAQQRKLQKMLYYELKCLEEELFTILEKKKRNSSLTDMDNRLERSSTKRNDVPFKQTSVQSLSLPRQMEKLHVVQDNGRDERVETEAQASLIGDVRMNCSITGHQILNKNALASAAVCSDSDIDNVSINYDVANISDKEEEHNFETIQMPSECTTNNSDHKNCAGYALPNKSEAVSYVPSNKKLNFPSLDEDNNESSSDSPSFELLAETPSPPTSIFIDEDHFSKSENNPEPSPRLDPDMSENSLYAINTNQKVYNKSLPGDDKKHPDLNKEKLMANACSPTSEPVFLMNESTSMIDWEHCSHSRNTRDLSTDIKTSHTSYPINVDRVDVESTDVLQVPRGCYQFQTDLVDFTQSFDSHTTSVTDSDAYATNGAYNGVNHKCTKRATQECRRNDDSKNKCQRAPVTCDTSQEKGEKDMKNGDKRQCSAQGGKCFCNEQSENTERADVRKMNPEEASGVTDPVLILPETLMTNAAHVASLAYGTAREMLVKIRVRTRDDTDGSIT